MCFGCAAHTPRGTKSEVQTSGDDEQEILGSSDDTIK